MANTFFTSDTHFGHQRVLELSKRPFHNVDEMNSALIENWNQVVGPNDTVYHLGDFGDTAMIHSLHGTILFLPGNYETKKDIESLSRHCQILKPNTAIRVKGVRFQLVHEPEEATPSDEFFSGKPRVFYLFGHIHKLQMVKRNGLNVGVDCHNFRPISIEEVLFYREAILNHYDENVFMQRLGESE